MFKLVFIVAAIVGSVISVAVDSTTQESKTVSAQQDMPEYYRLPQPQLQPQPQQPIGTNVVNPGVYNPNYGAYAYDYNGPIQYEYAPVYATNPEEHEQSSSVSYFGTVSPYVKYTLGIFSKIGVFLLSSSALLVLGGLLTTAVCTFTPFCKISFTGLGLNEQSVRSLVTPDNLSLATNFVQKAIDKYHSQNK